MNSPGSLTVPRFIAALIIGAAIPTLLMARPGELLPAPASVVERPGDVLAASVTEDGSVTLAGLFSRLDGVSSPGVGRLKSGGGVDGEFTAGIGISPPESVPAPGESAAMIVPCPVFQSLGGEFELIGDPRFPAGDFAVVAIGIALRPAQWVIFGDEGALRVNGLTAITPQEPVMPQFVEDGKLVAIVSSPEPEGEWRTRVRRLRLDTGADDDGFTAAATGIPAQALPAGGGGLWVLENASSGQRVSRLTASGSLDTRVGAIDVTATRTVLQAMPAGALAVSTSNWAWSDDSLSFAWTHRLQFLAADGTPETPRVQTGGAAPFFIEPNGSLLVESSPPAGVDPLEAARWRELSRELPSGQKDAAFNAIRVRRMVQRLPDGRLLADGTRRFLTNGAPDPSWREPAVLNHGGVHSLYAAPGGMVIGAGDFSQVDGQPRPGLARWRVDGVLDAGFVPSAAEGGVKDCAVGSDGSVIVLRSGALQRLHADGRTDAGFVLTWDNPSILVSPWEEVEPLPGGDVLALTAGSVVRISPQGHCTPVTWAGTWGLNGRGLHVLSDGRYFHAGRRWLANGTQDGSFNPPPGTGSVPLCAVGPDKWLFHRGGRGLSVLLPAALLRDDGGADETFASFFSDTRITTAAGGAGHTLYTAERNTIVRRHADGRRDVSFRAPRLERRNESIPNGTPLLSATRNGGDGAVYALLAHPLTGELWMAGNFTSAGGVVRSGIARLDASTPAGHAAWSEAVFQGAAAPEADADGDGLTNFHEYAAGTDPLLPDAISGSAVILHPQPLCISAPQNPAAPEVFQTLEISADLRAWRSATGAEAVRKTVNGRAAFELASAVGLRFVRIRYRSLP